VGDGFVEFAMQVERTVKTRRRVKQEFPLRERLIASAMAARRVADEMPEGTEKDSLLRKAREAEAVAKIDAWLSSPGLRRPK